MRYYHRSCAFIALAVLSIGCTSSRPMRGGQGQTESHRNALITTQLSDDFEDGDSTGWTVHDGNWSVATDGTKVFQGNSANSPNGYARASAGDLLTAPA